MRPVVCLIVTKYLFDYNSFYIWPKVAELHTFFNAYKTNEQKSTYVINWSL